MRLVITDIKELQSAQNTSQRVITDNGSIRNCIGCFGCWIKTPGQCVIRDGYENMGKLFSQCDELLIISKCFYGGFSPFVKNVLDRAISYISPHFVIRSGEMHHKRRYSNVINMTVYFYGGDITESEMKTAKSLVTANALNYDGRVNRVLFFNSADEAREALPL